MFAALRAKGIRPIKVVAADGSKANGEIRGVRKRIVAVAVVGAAAVTAIVTAVFRSTPTPSTYTSGDAAQPRQQIARLPASLEGVFRSDSELFLVQFAQPARSFEGTVPDPLKPLADDLCRSIEVDVEANEADSESIATLKGVVRGLKQEAARIIRSGRSPEEALRYFIDRQKMETEHRKRIVDQVLSGEMSKETANALFRSMDFLPMD